MSTIVYNPKFVTVNGRKTLNTTDVKNFIWSHARWFLNVGEMKKFPDEVGKALLKHIQFLIEVKKSNYEQIKSEIEEKKFKCDKCEFETNTKVAFLNHFKTHEKTEAIEGIDIPEAAPIGEYKGVNKVPISPEGDIPQGGTKQNPVSDGDGVEWYGEGLARDN